MHFVENFLRHVTAKNYENWFTNKKVITKIERVEFFWNTVYRFIDFKTDFDPSLYCEEAQFCSPYLLVLTGVRPEASRGAHGKLKQNINKTTLWTSYHCYLPPHSHRTATTHEAWSVWCVSRRQRDYRTRFIIRVRLIKLNEWRSINNIWNKSGGCRRGWGRQVRGVVTACYLMDDSQLIAPTERTLQVVSCASRAPSWYGLRLVGRAFYSLNVLSILLAAAETTDRQFASLVCRSLTDLVNNAAKPV